MRSLKIPESALFLLAVGLGLLLLTFASPPDRSVAKPTVLLYPPKMLSQFTLGYDEVVADILWLRVIQDFDMCEQSQQPLSEPTLPLAFAGATAKVGERAPSRCQGSWVYQMLDIITELAPKFRTPYETGAPMLSILVDDRVGALNIYEKGVERFPQSWKLHYGLGYHYLYEMQDIAKASVSIRKAAETGAPPWTYALAANLYSKVGQAQVGIAVLQEALEKNADGPGAERIKQRLDMLKAELAKARSSEKQD